MLIRLAIPADASAIARVHVETWQAAYRGQMPDSLLDTLDVGRRTAAWTEILRKNESTTFVAEIENEIIGFSSLMPSRDADADKKHTGEIAAIYVSPQHWRKGVGRQLCERVLAEARKDGLVNVTLWVLKINSPAQKFYEKLGFILDGGEKTQNFGGNDLPEVRYRVLLLSGSRSAD